MKQIFLSILFSLFVFGCSGNESIKTGAEHTEQYFELLQNKRVAVVANQSSRIEKVHLVDSLLSAGIKIMHIYSPEHGFRGTADAGETVQTGIDAKTGLSIVSLYGSNKKPKLESLSDVDIVLFDLQDVGVRFYTYFATMHYVMEACAQTNTAFMVLDRPNPNGHYIDGPVLEEKYYSFVGKHPVPLVHGMTAAEYARMINGEGWLENGAHCQLSWIECSGYAHDLAYDLPVKPSPNLPNARAIAWYPTLGLFEGVNMSIGRGTDFPFQVLGHPAYPVKEFVFTPESRPGAAKNPRYKAQQCFGYDLRDSGRFEPQSQLVLSLLLEAYNQYPDKSKFFKAFFLNLSGTAQLKNDIIAGKNEAQIRESWKTGLLEFQMLRKKYLLYPDAKWILENFQ